jgi:MFS family permease
MSPTSRPRMSRDFRLFWSGQVISVLGTSFTQFAEPLLVYHLTHSAVNLGIDMAVSMLPYLLFGLVIGAWVDRLDRRKLMIAVNIGLAVSVAVIPAGAAVGHLSVLLVYVSGFVTATLFIFFSSAEFAALPSLVESDDLVTANGRIQASYSAATIAGPLLAGALSAFLPIPDLLLVDAGSYLVSAVALALVRRSFNAQSTAVSDHVSTIRHDIVEGLRYVLGHPVLRSISLMMALVNFISSSEGAQLVLFSKQQLHADNPQISLLFAASGAGVVVCSLLAGRLRKRWAFSTVALGALTTSGLFLAAFALSPWFWLSVPLWAISTGTGVLFNINTLSLRQAIVPNHLLGRIMSIASVIAWSAIPLGALLGGVVIQAMHTAQPLFLIMGVATVVIPIGFTFSPLGRAEQYLPVSTGGDGRADEHIA